MNNNLKTPYFLIKKNELDTNILEFEEALKKYWPNSNLAYSIKTNSLPWLLKYLNKKGIIAEAVSKEEYDLAKMCGYVGNDIIFNGPIKQKDDITCAFEDNSIVNIDSQREVEYLKKYKPSLNGNLGIRINVNPNVFDEKDVGYAEDGFRFGFAEENGELKKIVELIREIYGDISFGLHLHCNSVTRSLNVYKSIAKYAANIIKKYQLKPSFIDMGGGFFGGVPGKTTADEYIETIKNELCNVVDIKETKLFIEPGSAIIGSVVDFYTSVVDVKKTHFANIITTDGSRINIDPLWAKKSYLYSLISECNNQIENKQIICGYTCMDHDRIMSIENKNLLSEGDKIIYHRVGAYTMTFGGPFIRYFPDVYVKTNDEIEKVRERMDVGSYYSIHSL